MGARGIRLGRRYPVRKFISLWEKVDDKNKLIEKHGIKPVDRSNLNKTNMCRVPRSVADRNV